MGDYMAWYHLTETRISTPYAQSPQNVLPSFFGRGTGTYGGIDY